jgi:hypothetical protein
MNEEGRERREDDCNLGEAGFFPFGYKGHASLCKKCPKEQRGPREIWGAILACIMKVLIRQKSERVSRKAHESREKQHGEE